MGFWAERAALQDDVATLLAQLGGSAGEVAEFLSAMGIRVGPATPADSAAARYLHAVIGADDRVEQVKVTRRSVAVRTHHKIGRMIRVQIPDPVRDFVASVDDRAAAGETTVPGE